MPAKRHNSDKTDINVELTSTHHAHNQAHPSQTTNYPVVILTTPAQPIDPTAYIYQTTMPNPFKLDRTAHHAGTHAETERYHAQNQGATPTERVRNACVLTAQAWGYDPEHPPRLDRTAFATRRHEK